MALDNDTRGWIMTCVSGVACVIGASIICVDLVVQQIPRYRHWRIQDSNAFLSASLSLSFGVMLYSSLYNILPSAKSSLISGGLSPSNASWVLIGCFLGGVVGITIVSRLIHRNMPSHVVDCDHTHDDADDEEEGHAGHNHAGHHGQEHDHDHDHNHHHHEQSDDEDTPLLSRSISGERRRSSRPKNTGTETLLRPEAPSLLDPSQAAASSDIRRPSIKRSLTKRMTTFMAGGKAECDEFGPCHGYSEPCGQECFKAITRTPSFAPARRSTGLVLHREATFRSATRNLEDGNERHEIQSRRDTSSRRQSGHSSDHYAHHHANGNGNGVDNKSSDDTVSEGQAHHHHVPANAFLSIGLQTSIAIALHKLPEGFITYATNHANPKLGFSVFMALFIHNITEGFAMALPLYLAIGSRGKAMLWSSLLGGVSQPLGAGIAALWFHAADSSNMAPSEGVYGGMFAVTSGIMTSVALQLFSESLGLTHNKNLCTAFAFVGMGILGISNALTA